MSSPADVAQLVAHHLAKVRVASSSLVIRSGSRFMGILLEAVLPRWNGRVVRQRSAKPCTRVRFPFPPLVTMAASSSLLARLAQLVEHYLDTVGVTGSSPVSRTREISAKPNFSKETGPVVFFCGCSAVGSASPCQGEGREFESRHPLWFSERDWRRFFIWRSGAFACLHGMVCTLAL